ncbi:(Protein-PII) uridylyltransferase / (Protein-PII)-UMP uridylyl-removing enzyme [Gammaproteobacteria bacterium]
MCITRTIKEIYQSLSGGSTKFKEINNNQKVAANLGNSGFYTVYQSVTLVEVDFVQNPEPSPSPVMIITAPLPSPPISATAPRFDELLNTAALDAALAAGEPPLKTFRTALKTANQILRERFYAGVPATDLVPLRVQVMDALLARTWHRYGLAGELDTQERVMARTECSAQETDTTAAHEGTLCEPEGIALLAVGGYGRGELHPGSDIDLMVLLGHDDHDHFRERIENWVTFLWDIGLEVGHSVRSLEECVEEAHRDVTVATNLMEARLLGGPITLLAAMSRACESAMVWPSRVFFETKHDEQLIRHRKYHDTAYNLEPNVKEGPGGLRDIHMVGWVTKRHFGANSLHGLVDVGFLTEAEYNTLIEGQNFLWQIRWGLHLLAGRREDRLLFDHQRSLAATFGYRDTPQNLAVEQFMKRYYCTAQQIGRLNEMLLQLFHESLQPHADPVDTVPLNRRFRARNGFLEVNHDRVFRRYPFALLELFLVMAQHPELSGVRATTIRLVRDHLFLIDDAFRTDLRNRSLFMELVKQPRGIYHELHRMHRYGVLAAYLPVFGGVVGQMQHDLFHVYTVDEHTLRVVRNLRRFFLPEHAHENPLCSHIAQTLPKPHLLYLGGLFHDIAKGRGGDHPILGAVDALAFCQTHGLPTFDSRLVAWLVEHHVTMSRTAQRQDTSDSSVVDRFATLVGDNLHLDYLYLLTVADIRAIDPALWTSWKDALLSDLYQTTRRVLRRGISGAPDLAEQVRETQDEARRLLHTFGVPRPAIESLWQTLADDFFIRYTPDEIASNTQAIIAHRDGTLPLVLVRQRTRRGGTEVFVHTYDQDGLFAQATSTLDQLGLTIMDARIVTSSHGYTLDSYIVLEENGEPISSQPRLDEIREVVRARLSQPFLPVVSPPRRSPLRLKHFPIPTEVHYTLDERNQRTVMEVVSQDRPGLLARIGQALVTCEVRVQNAKIDTVGARADDIFFVTDRNNRPLGEEFGERLRAAIVELVDGAGK